MAGLFGRSSERYQKSKIEYDAFVEQRYF